MQLSSFHWNALYATLALSLMLHGLALMGYSLQRPPEPPKMRMVVAKVDLVNKLELPRTPPKIVPKLAVPPPELVRPVVQAGHKGTRPGTGGDPAPAPKSLRMKLPEAASRARSETSNVLRDRSIDGDDRGDAFGDPNGVHGGTGTGGSGPGGTGGGGDGGVEGHEAVLKSGRILCLKCHNKSIRPLNIEALSLESGWKLGGPLDVPPHALEFSFELSLSAEGKVKKLRLLKTPTDPALTQALIYFAGIHEFTPPGAPTTFTVTYYFIPQAQGVQ